MDQPLYRTTSTSNATAQVDDIELDISENNLTRKVLRAEIIKNEAEKEKNVKVAIVHQRRAKITDGWVDLGGPGLNRIKAGDASKMALNSSETCALFSHLERLYEIGKGGIRSGSRVLTVADTDTIIKAPANRANVIKRLLAAKHGEEVWNTLVEDDPGLASRLALSRIYDDRKRVVDEFERNLSEGLTEEYWQKLLESNRWIFGSCYVGFIEERRVNLKSTLDHPLVGEDGCLEVVEIKRPDFPFWKLRTNGDLALYRNKYLVPYAELNGAISQASNYILELERKMD